MTEAEWLGCSDPRPMLEFLRSRGSERKFRLFACACCRRIWPLLRDETVREVIDIAERFSDGLVGQEARSQARKTAQQVAESRGVTPRPFSVSPKWQRRAASSVYYAAAREGMDAACNASLFTGEALIWRAGGYNVCDVGTIMAPEQSSQAIALRDIFGNPFHSVALDTIWQSSCVTALAQAAYEERFLPEGTLDSVRLAILADALEDAGCTDVVILDHLRGPGPHVRGCFVVDALLGKK